MEMQSGPASSSRILYDVPCVVCHDHSSGKHYGVFACDGCAGFFKRSVRRQRNYTCKARESGTCLVDKAHRNQCRACRLTKCVKAGMNKDAVQNERGPRNSTIRRQLALCLKEPAMPMIATEMEMVNFPEKMLKCPNPALTIDAQPFMTTKVPMVTSEAICEAAARLLFMNVKWAQNTPAFSALSMPDRLLLLEDSWKEMFILGAVQFLLPLDFNILSKENQVSKESIQVFEAALQHVSQIGMDDREFACVRTLALFKTSVTCPARRHLHDLRAIATIQDHLRAILNDYITTKYAHDVNRLGRILLMLPILNTVPSVIIVKLFFASTIGNTPIERIISDMYKGTTDVF